MFTKFHRQLEFIPPTKDALEQHIRRASLQSQIWTQSLQRVQHHPDPADFGWKKCGGIWEPVWRTKPVASEACDALVKCSCKKGCIASRCKCLKNPLNAVICVIAVVNQKADYSLNSSCKLTFEVLFCINIKKFAIAS